MYLPAAWLNPFEETDSAEQFTVLVNSILPIELGDWFSTSII